MKMQYIPDEDIAFVNLDKNKSYFHSLFYGQTEQPGYIFNSKDLTEDDRMIITRRTVTCVNTKPFVQKLGNDYCIQWWYGDVTEWPGYEEYDEAYK